MDIFVALYGVATVAVVGFAIAAMFINDRRFRRKIEDIECMALRRVNENPSPYRKLTFLIPEYQLHDVNRSFLVKTNKLKYLYCRLTKKRIVVLYNESYSWPGPEETSIYTRTRDRDLIAVTNKQFFELRLQGALTTEDFDLVIRACDNILNYDIRSTLLYRALREKE